MGIPLFFKLIREKFPSIISSLSNERTIEELGNPPRKNQNNRNNNTTLAPEIGEVDYLYIDMNGIIHQCAQLIYSYGTFEGNSKRRPRSLAKFESEEMNLFSLIGQRLDMFIRILKPSRGIMISVDGVAPLAKMMQQRQRRFRSASEAAEKNDNNNAEKLAFNPNSVSSGTEFMDRFHEFLCFFIRLRVNDDPEWRNLKVIYSSHNVPGEGESKIMHQLKSFERALFHKDKHNKRGPERDFDRSYNHFIYGLDADLIVLSLRNYPFKGNIKLFRESNQKGLFVDYFINPRSEIWDKLRDKPCFFMIDIGMLQDELVSLMQFANQPKPLINRRNERLKSDVIDDFILITYLLGNDFIPRSPGIDVSNLFDLIDIYCSCGLPLNIDGFIRMDNLMKFLSQIPEDDLIRDKIKNPKLHPIFESLTDHEASHGDNPVNENLNKILDLVNETPAELRRLYYSQKLGIKHEHEIERLCKHYIDAFSWINSYYIHRITSWRWKYGYHYAPFISDILRFRYGQKKVQISEPFTQIEQLIMILPKEGGELIRGVNSQQLRKLHVNFNDLFPSHVEIDRDHTDKDWEGISLTPIVKYKELLPEISKCVTDSSYNRHDKEISLTHDHKVHYRFSNNYGRIGDCSVRFVVLDR
jgi:5'-3' exonuclease